MTTNRTCLSLGYRSVERYVGLVCLRAAPLLTDLVLGEGQFVSSSEKSVWSWINFSCASRSESLRSRLARTFVSGQKQKGCWLVIGWKRNPGNGQTVGSNSEALVVKEAPALAWTYQ